MNRAEALPRLPLALYGLLVVGAALALFPRAAEPLLSPLRWLACLPLRALPAMDALASSNDAGHAEALVASTRVRQAQGAVGQLDARVAGARPIVCRVLERRVAGAAGLPSLLVLDRSFAELAGCLPYATHGDQLVGKLGQPQDLEDPRARGLAIVRCLHHRPRQGAPQRLVVAVALAERPLGLVVEPGSRIDVWPLRAALIEDPYRAARLGGGGQAVHTRVALGGSSTELQVGTFRVWGYADEVGALPVGYHVELGFDPRALSTCVLWRADAASAPPVAAVRELPARAARGTVLPGEERLYVVVPGARSEVGAAVSARGGLVGVVEDAGFGDAVAARFGSPGQTWALVLVPDAADAAPVEFSGTVVGRDGEVVALQVAVPLPDLSGDVLTGGNGLASPTGLRVGRIEAIRDEGRRLLVRRPPLDLLGLAVCVRPEAGS